MVVAKQMLCSNSSCRLLLVVVDGVQLGTNTAGNNWLTITTSTTTREAEAEAKAKARTKTVGSSKNSMYG